MLELVVKVYNINKGRNEELMSRSAVLKEYSIFIYLVREHASSTPHASPATFPHKLRASSHSQLSTLS
ncbi:MAG: hypothetical protein FWB90_05295 [Fibromonadales bacterium]|nr:hypothetical protein [Fibromonadales bacterium]